MVHWPYGEYIIDKTMIGLSEYSCMNRRDILRRKAEE